MSKFRMRQEPVKPQREKLYLKCHLEQYSDIGQGEREKDIPLTKILSNIRDHINHREKLYGSESEYDLSAIDSIENIIINFQLAPYQGTDFSIKIPYLESIDAYNERLAEYDKNYKKWIKWKTENEDNIIQYNKEKLERQEIARKDKIQKLEEQKSKLDEELNKLKK